MRNLTYSCLSTGTFAELIEVNEELADTDSILGDAGLNSLLNVIFVTQHSCLALIVALMTVSRCAHVLNVITD